MPTQTKRPRDLKLVINPRRLDFGSDVTITVTAENYAADAAREIGVLIQVFHRRGGLLVSDPEPLFNGLADLHTGNKKVRIARTYTPTFVGRYLVRAVVWNSKAAERPQNGADHRTRAKYFRMDPAPEPA